MEKEQEPKFKKGDKVICIEGCAFELTTGKVYTVEKPLDYTSPEFTRVVCNTGKTYPYLNRRFIPCLPSMESLYS